MLRSLSRLIPGRVEVGPLFGSICVRFLACLSSKCCMSYVFAAMGCVLTHPAMLFVRDGDWRAVLIKKLRQLRPWWSMIVQWRERPFPLSKCVRIAVIVGLVGLRVVVL
ncbi:hypothetical protein CONLIGDRAFT_214583 [Coniochaeta ligniaria NRRL 30616]|uniref:Uncharacterized protein n=1 Tax=Coniochaeta ligniaria NRRL 30616 TaxID=1408157 RepID=A0A1J7J349_9PEZI|nr:hypothetical protein CONLIGDRAFT_214583 [Coniochaeta ligniaria NRRL 30616]